MARKSGAAGLSCNRGFSEDAPVVLEEFMAKRCEVCGKGPVVGRTVSHAHNVGPRRFEPNLQSVRAVVNGGNKKIRVCTRCLRSGKVTKAA